MDLEQRAQELKERIELMKACYMKGFGNLVVGIKNNSYTYGNEGSERHKSLTLEEIGMIERHYEAIPFNELDSNEDFAPLFVVRDLLKWYIREVREFLEEPEEDKFKSIAPLEIAVGYAGVLYKNNLNRRLAELRKIPGYEHFRIEIIDYKGAHFVM